MNFEKLTTVLNRRLQRTRKPFDLFGLYRAVTRAQLMVLVVNEFLPGGWLEFLGHVRLRAEGFDRREEMERAEARAVEGVVLSTLAAALAAGAPSASQAPRGIPARANLRAA